VWPEAIITYAKWGDTHGRLSLAARRPAQRARGYAAMPSRRRASPAAARRRAGPRGRQARRAAAGTSTHHPAGCDPTRRPAVVSLSRFLCVLSRLSCTT